MKHKLRPLPYAVDALEPHLSRETLEYHHGKHHRTYVNKLNELVQGTPFEQASLEDIVRKSSDAVFNNAAQVWNHDFYWDCLSPEGGGKPAGEVGRAITSSFGSFAQFKEKFSQAAEGRFGSGWAWLALGDNGSLDIFTTANADTPLKSGKTALLTCDVWEHAYYIDYRNARPDYIKAFWNLVNWEFVERNLQEAKSGSPAVATSDA
jgi:superoxide dismutase, Fe-Mn family